MKYPTQWRGPHFHHFFLALSLCILMDGTLISTSESSSPYRIHGENVCKKMWDTHVNRCLISVISSIQLWPEQYMACIYIYIYTDQWPLYCPQGRERKSLKFSLSCLSFTCVKAWQERGDGGERQWASDGAVLTRLFGGRGECQAQVGVVFCIQPPLVLLSAPSHTVQTNPCVGYDKRRH